MKNQQPLQIRLCDSPLSYDDPQLTKRLGLIALATDLTSERDFVKLMPHDQIGIFTSRVAYENPTTPESLRDMAPRLSAAADLILPGESLEAICYSCTAASVVIGDEVVTQAIHTVRPGVPVVTPSAAARLAFTALGVKRISILTPYLIETSQPMADYFTQHGLAIQSFDCLGLDDDRDMARIGRNDIIEAAIRADVPEAEALFISCTAVPAVATIAEIEKRIGKPVVTSNQASAWAMLRHAGLQHNPVGYGRLFDLDLPQQN
jgi:maleate isomerase